ncbi:hypothetical protein Tco_1118369, partial [Tanacetum coccineum]
KLLETVEKPVGDKVMPEVEASYSAVRFGNLPFTPQWGLTDSSHMDNSHKCRDMMSNLFTPADLEFFNEGVRHESAHANLVYAHESYKGVKAQYKECKKELAKAHSAYDEKASAYDHLSKNYDGALTREKILQDRLEEIEEEKKKAHHLNSSKADRIKQLEEELKQSASSSTFMEAYEQLFDKRYPVVDKVSPYVFVGSQ